ncbi:MAG: cellulose binding domain-containing protein [Janthinobacterium lividum]
MTNFASLTTRPAAPGATPAAAPHGGRALARIVLLLCLLLGGLSQRSYAAADSKGTDFWLTFPGNYATGTTLTLFITGDVATTGTVSITGLGFSAPFTVVPGTVTSVVVPAGAELFDSDVVASNGIHVTSGQEMTVYGLNRLSATTDAYLALPTDVLGTQYINLGYLNSEFSGVMGTQFAIVGTVNGTTVTITPTVAAGTRAANVPYTITLNQGQTYLLRSTGAYPADLSGTIISSTQPISVFGSNKCANVPHNHAACDHLVEQLPPTTAWGKQFVTVPLKTRLNGDTFRFLASVNNTEVRVNGTLVATLNRGQYHERIIAGSSQVTATQPILVAQYSNGSDYDGVVSDPFMMLIPPTEQFLGSYTVTTPASGFSGNYINLVAPTVAVGTVRLDGAVVPASSFSAIGSSGYSGAQLTVSLGAHQITGGLYPVGVFVYGFDSYDSYGYPGGQSFAPVATVSSLTLTPATGTAQTGTSYCVSATVKDQFNSPVVGVRVDFGVSGVNPTSGFNNTDASGVAMFCYTGTKAGPDNIIASIGALTKTAQVTWSTPCNLQLTTAVTNAGCSATGAIGLTVANGTGPYTYAWTGPNGFMASTKDISGLAAGTYVVNVTDNATQCTATTSAVVTGVCAATIAVQYQTGDLGQPTDNALRPFLQLMNTGTTAVPYSQLTVRYWLTVENFSPMITPIDWAKLGTSFVSSRYVMLATPRQGALGYIEYSFAAGAGDLAAGANSGPIYGKAYKQNYTNFDETNDWSYQTSSSFVANDHITLYQNGTLIAGTEPPAVAANTSLKVYAGNQDTSPSTSYISVALQVGNVGNVPVNFADLKVRYWFTPDGTQPLVYGVDYTPLGNQNFSLQTGQKGTQTYAELSFASALGVFYPISNTGATGNIQFKIRKDNYGAFNQTNDYSFSGSSAIVEQPRITAYLNGVLVFGTEPEGAAANALGEPLGKQLAASAPKGQADASATATSREALELRLTGSPNPFTDELRLQFALPYTQAYTLAVYDGQGRLVRQLASAEAAAGQPQQLDVPTQTYAAGLYLVRLTTATGEQHLKFVKH